MAMKQSRLLEHLAHARRHVAEGHVHVARQRAIVVRLEARGEDASQARRALATLEEMQATHIADCAKLEKAWEGNGEPFSPEDMELRCESAHAAGRASMEELRWYQEQIAQTGNVLRRAKEALEASQAMLAKLDDADPRAEQAG